MFSRAAGPAPLRAPRRRPGAADPAIWYNAASPGDSLVLGALNDGGLIVFDLRGTIRQAVLPPNAPQITPADPPTTAGLNPAGLACPESESGETFGRFNNVDLVEGFEFAGRTIDLAVVTDRGCDRIRFYEVTADGVADITSPGVERVFPERHDTLLQPVRSFGLPYWAIPDDEEFECEIEPEGEPEEGTIESEERRNSPASTSKPMRRGWWSSPSRPVPAC